MFEKFGGSTILITGGTGSFGRAFIKEIAKYNPRKVIVYSRDEYKQYLMAEEYDYDFLRYFLGDVRDEDRLVDALGSVDYVIHAAALKQVPALEYNPIEAIKTNVGGATNLIRACNKTGVEKVVALSTDKAVNPINLYGATKLCAEKLFTAANTYNDTRFSCVRYGNVIGSRGSVIPLFQKLKEQGERIFPVTDVKMTRFWITMKEAIELVLRAFEWMDGGEIYVPHIPSMSIVDVALSIDPECQIKEIGIRPGEKLHECLISEDMINVWLVDGDKKVKAKSIFISNTNDKWLTAYELRKELGIDNSYV